MANKQKVTMYPPAPLSPATIAELPWFFLLLIFAVISEKERQESGQRERSMTKEMETMKEKIKELEGERKELETWKEGETKWRENEEKQKDAAAKTIKGLEGERVTLKKAGTRKRGITPPPTSPLSSKHIQSPSARRPCRSQPLFNHRII
ncbi:hypothetical protein ONZ45_g12170 [Pleurotus djamor]|nr:hypothetical protein ONZ45_g12170 [Pleurotus djamor]